ncbi:hypothetical protein ACHHYP_12677 [Achlya hypogyna]|uniref:C3H1-type domain-containing protein n=1 Tax=Achlya hypogyna TaxID=1202772 RepID=A0A1V9ZH32_ACHHY|nr:hypothetical protein ACHHYP_12677 [Achlya hypogyna]
MELAESPQLPAVASPVLSPGARAAIAAVRAAEVSAEWHRAHPLVEPLAPTPLIPPAKVKKTIPVTDKPLRDFANDVYKELRCRSRQERKPRLYGMCSSNKWCSQSNCNFAHSSDELKVVGVARAIAKGSMWKSTPCNVSERCSFGSHCDYLHDDDDRMEFIEMKRLARLLVDHTYAKTEKVLEIVFSDGKTTTVLM